MEEVVDWVVGNVVLILFSHDQAVDLACAPPPPQRWAGQGHVAPWSVSAHLREHEAGGRVYGQACQGVFLYSMCPSARSFRG